MLKIYIHKNHPDAVIPQISYNNTSACFDITCVEDTIIPAKGYAIVPNGLNICIDQEDNYWMQIQLRSSLGFKFPLIPHAGVIDAGYTGDLGIRINNIGDMPLKIEKGQRYAQIAVFEKPQYKIIELDDDEFFVFQHRQQRGDGGFGSSGK